MTYVVNTLAEWNALLNACGCCGMPACGEPRKECQSIEEPICAFHFPDACYLVTEEGEECRGFREISFVYHKESSIEPLVGSATVTQTEVEHWETAFKYEYLDGVCTLFILSGSYSRVLTTTSTAGPEGNPETQNWVEVFTQTGTAPVGVFSFPHFVGTETFTSTRPGGEPYSGAFSRAMGLDSISPCSSRDGLVFSSIQAYPRITITRTQTFSAEIANSDDALVGLEFPADANGTYCYPLFECDSARKTRYRFGVPLGYTGSTYELQWDYVFFPAEWDAWRILKDAFIDNPGLPDPGPAPEPAPHFIAENVTWTRFDGDFSDWYPTDPVGATTNGEARTVNIQVVCTRSIYGEKPSFYGEIYNPLDYE